MKINRTRCYFSGNAYDAHVVSQQYEKDIEYFENKLVFCNNEEQKKTYENNLIKLKKHYKQLEKKLQEFEFEIDYLDN